VLYVTERCVFRLTPEGLSLAEVAPGVDPERDIRPFMDFAPAGGAAAPMPGMIFRDARMGLRERMDDLRLETRVVFHEGARELFLDFEGMRIRSESDIEAIRAAVEAALDGVEERVDVVVNYTRFEIDRALEEPYAAMVRDLEARRYDRVRRHASNAFARLRIDRSLGRPASSHR
jgi:propionate CoA-transferase